MSVAFDKETLRQKYREERDKRIREDGNDQYLEIKDQLGHYLEDPYVEKQDREPLTDASPSPTLGWFFRPGCRRAPKEAGVTDVIIEKGGDFGGTWYWNRYPGAQCDTATFVYMPLLEETGHMPTEKYAHAPEF